MNVIFGWDAYYEIGDKYTRLELNTVKYKGIDDPVTLFALAGPDELPLENLIRLKQFIPIHAALIENYKEQNWIFCIEAIGQLKGNICDFMDEFYDSLMDSILKAQKEDAKDWNPIINDK